VIFSQPGFPPTWEQNGGPNTLNFSFTLCEGQKRRDKHTQEVYCNGKPLGDKPHFFKEQVSVYVGQ